MDAPEQFGQAVVDALTATIAVIEQDGTIRAVNEAWKRFARENGGGRSVTSTGVGVNYLAVCRRAQGAFSEEAPHALIGIQHVLQGKQASFQLEYPCHSPTERRWFLMSVTPLKQSPGAVIAHLNITERKLAEEAVQRSEARARRLIESNILGIFFWRDGQITEANEIFLQLLGYTRQELLTGMFPEAELRKCVKFSTNNSSALLWAIIKGAGIGWLPTYIPAIAGPLVPLDLDIRFQLDIWLTYHPDAKRIPRVKQLIEWAIQAFDGRKYLP